MSGAGERPALQLLGVVLVVVGGQGVVRQLVHPDRAWLLGWLPGGAAVRLTVYGVATVAGVVLAVWSRSGAAGREPPGGG